MHGGPGKYTVRGGSVDVARAAIREQGGNLHQRAGGIHLIINYQGVLAGDIANELQDLGVVVVGHAAFFAQGEGTVQHFGEVAGAFGAAQVWGHDNAPELPGPEVVRQEPEGGEFIRGDVEKALDLPGVEINGQYAVGAGRLNEVGEQAGGNRDAGLVLFIGAAVGEIGDHRGDPAGAGAADGINHDQQLHDGVVDRAGAGLHQEDITFTDVVANLDEDIFVRELENISFAQGLFQRGADGRRQVTVGVATEDDGTGQGHAVYSGPPTLDECGTFVGVSCRCWA